MVLSASQPHGKFRNGDCLPRRKLLKLKNYFKSILSCDQTIENSLWVLYYLCSQMVVMMMMTTTTIAMMMSMTMTAFDDSYDDDDDDDDDDEGDCVRCMFALFICTWDPLISRTCFWRISFFFSFDWRSTHLYKFYLEKKLSLENRNWKLLGITEQFNPVWNTSLVLLAINFSLIHN